MNNTVDNDHVIIHDPINNKNPITEIFAYLSVDQDGNEGIIATGRQDADGIVHHAPMITSNANNLLQMKQDADELANFTKKKIILAQFKRVKSNVF